MSVNKSSAYEYEPRTGRLRKAMQGGIETRNVRLVYNEAADELLVFLFTDVHHSVAIEAGNNSYLLGDPTTNEVIGFQFDCFMDQVVLERPSLLAFATFAGVEPDQIEKARARIGSDRERDVMLQSAMRDLVEGITSPV